MASERPPLSQLRLRQDLRLYPGPKIGHAPSWMLYDPARHAYFQLDPTAVAVMSAWRDAATADTLFAAIEAEGEAAVGRADVDDFVAFAERNELVEDAASGWRAHGARAAAARSSPLMWLVHNYLFIKVPVVRPRRFFERTAFLVAPLFTRAFLLTTIAAALVAAYLVSRQWDAFLGTFPAFVSLDGAMVYGLTLFGVKAVHELGHAATAARHRCRISSIGVAFMVMVPMLYCDVTDSWRLADRRQRMAIDVAGIATELALAVYAALAWVLLPDGAPRTAAFLVSTASLLSSLAINLNPFMRFDGYLMLADALNVPNLQARAFALLRWRLREGLFALRAPKPDVFGPPKQRVVLAYAAAIVAYRAVLYAGIAVIVYHAFFKLLGIALFTVEVGWFLVAPVAREVIAWWRVRDTIAMTRRSLATGALASLALLLLVVPFRTRVAVPAVMEPAVYARVFPPGPGMIRSVAVAAGEAVEAGQVIAVLVSPKLDEEERLARVRLALVEARLGRGASLAADKAETLSLDMERRLLLDRLDGLARERGDLVLKSPIAGIVRDLDPDLDPGRWVGRDAEIALVTAPGAAVVRGYVPGSDVDRIAVGSAGTFVPDGGLARGLPTRVSAIAYAAAARVDIPALSSLTGGPIAAREGADHGAIPEAAIYPATFDVDHPAARSIVRGTVVVDGARRSVAAAVLTSVGRVLVREGGF